MALGTAVSGAAVGAGLGSSVLPGIGTAVGGIVGFLGGLFGGGDSDSKQYIDKAIQQLIAVNIPDPAQQAVAFKQYQLTGQLDPKLEQAIKANPTALQQIVKNTQYSSAQNKALTQLQDLGEQGGLNLSDKANLQQELVTSANKDKANRGAIADDFARRGQGGSGMALQAQLAGEQSAGDRDSQSRLQALGGAQDRALKSIMGAGDLAGKLSDQDYSRQNDLAQAKDRINQFNTTNAQAVAQRNTAAQNAAAAENLENRQKVSNANTDIANKQEQYNKNLSQQNYENQMEKAKAESSAYTGAATNANQQQQRQDQQLGGGIAGVGQLATGINSQNRWDDFMKKWKTT